MAYGQFNTFRSYKRQMMTAAIELGYGDKVVKLISNASTTDEINNILNRARRRCMMEDKWKVLD